MSGFIEADREFVIASARYICTVGDLAAVVRSASEVLAQADEPATLWRIADLGRDATAVDAEERLDSVFMGLLDRDAPIAWRIAALGILKEGDLTEIAIADLAFLALNYARSPQMQPFVDASILLEDGMTIGEVTRSIDPLSLREELGRAIVEEIRSSPDTWPARAIRKVASSEI